MLFSRSVQLRTTHCRVCVTWFEKTPQRGSSPDTCRGRQRKTGCRDRDVEDLGPQGWDLASASQTAKRASGWHSPKPTGPKQRGRTREGAWPFRDTQRPGSVGSIQVASTEGLGLPWFPSHRASRCLARTQEQFHGGPASPSLPLLAHPLQLCLPATPPTAFPAAADSAQGADPKGDDQQCMKNLFN